MNKHLKQVALAAALSFFAGPAFAQWFTEDNHTYAYSSGREISVSCSDQYGGPNIQVFTARRLPERENPNVVFIFDGQNRVPWTATHTARIYSGPLADPYDTDHRTYLLWFDFDNFGEALGYWRSLVDDFSEHNSVSIEVNGTRIGPYSLAGSARALSAIIAQSRYRC